MGPSRQRVGLAPSSRNGAKQTSKTLISKHHNHNSHNNNNNNPRKASISAVHARGEIDGGEGSPETAPFRESQYVSYDLSSSSRSELGELRSRLVAELDAVRQLTDRIESGRFSSRSNQTGPVQKKPSSSGHKRPLPPPTASNNLVPPDSAAKRSNNNNNTNISEIGENQNLGQNQNQNLGQDQNQNRELMRNCALILTKLMRHKHSWPFKTPVDAVKLQLHDYHNIVKRPMDLGTVKSRLNRNLYASPVDFADDVKLTFKNAMVYNPKGHDVYVMAEQLLGRFEDLFQPMYKEIEGIEGENRDEERRVDQGRVYDEHRVLDRDRGYDPRREEVYDEELASSWSNVEPEREVKEREVKSDQTRVQKQARSQSPVQNLEPARSGKPVKQPKPKAKDPNKREMTLEEKHKLGVGLQSLPQEKMEQVVQIISKRNGHLRHDGDEIELDIEAVDTETLWELDRLVTNFKKMMSKIKRQGLINNAGSGSIEHIEEEPENEQIDVGVVEARTPRREAGDEDVDIDDDMPVSSYAPVVIEKDDGAAGGATGGGASSSSSSSGSDSSSSSDSDSGSSSGSDSEADNAQS